ncbi:Sensor histidine kinase YehU [Dyella sp. AD56]|uniref:sensor histidine kinase n=1 Tax=Dyella sp. AD56 TaxID=1528744 RepID=UPI000C85095B|nr:histidine kinase [Dyella sp. AD56]PMQ06709.1 Sensor histidine kinase YehU [Dyella sp. AD56]
METATLDCMNELFRLPPAATLGEQGTPFSPKTLATLWVAFWLLMISVSLQDTLHSPLIRWWEPVLWEGSSALIATGWMWLAVRFREQYAPYLDRPLIWFGRYLRWQPLVILTWLAMVYPIRHGVYAAVGRAYVHPGWGFVVMYESVKLTIFTGLWLGILFGIDSYGQWQLQRRRLLQMQKALAEAQLAHLQAQLRPHFLFNALNTVSALMHTDVARADRLVAALGDLLRISLRSTESEMTPLAEEIRTLALYGDIMNERFRDRVTLNWQTDQALLDTPVPALLLQPLLENVFKHGVERTVARVRIHISVQRDSDSLEIVVSNSGSMLEAEHREGLGFRSCRERLNIIYGNAASLRVGNEGDGVAARVRIPLVGTAA